MCHAHPVRQPFLIIQFSFFSDAYNMKEIFLSIFITQDLNLRLASCEVQRSSSNVNVNFNNKTHHHLETIAMEE